MFYEYVLRPDARGKLIQTTLSRGSVYLFSGLFIYAWLRFLEPQTLESFGSNVYIGLGFVVFASVYTMFRMYFDGIKFRMITTDTDIQFTRMNGSVTVKYADLVRVERTPNNILLVYTVSSASRPVIAVSDTITNREQFEAIISQFTPITTISKIPLQLRTIPRLTFVYLYMTSLLLNLVSFNSDTIIGSGILVIGLSIYTLIILFRFREEVKSPVGSVVILLLAILMLIRIFLVTYAFNTHIS